MLLFSFSLRTEQVHHEVDVSLSCDSLLTVPSARLRSCSPVIECAFINKRSGAKLGDTFLKVLDEISDVPVHNLDEEDPEEVRAKSTSRSRPCSSQVKRRPP